MVDLINKIYDEQKSFFSNNIRNRDISFRIENLKKLKKNILKYENEILLALKKDLNKNKAEAIITEISFCISEIDYNIKNLKKLSKDKKVKKFFAFPLSKSYIRYEPLGVVLIISPWNYPFNLAISPLIGAISAGNCVIIKPSEISSNTSFIIKKLIEDTFKEKYVSVILGDAVLTQKLLDKKFDYIFYTGSGKIGKLVMEKASKNLTPLTLELGGKSPCIIDKDTDLDISAKRIVFGKFINSGQTCIAPDYLFVDKTIKKKLIEKLISNIEIMYNKENYGKIINQNHLLRLKNYLKNVDIIYGGDVDEKKNTLSPTLIENIKVNNLILEEEIFGPILPIFEYKNKEEVIDFINQKEKPLALYIFSNNNKFQNEIISNTQSGGVCINDTIIHIGNNELPFGGVGGSGFGSYHGKYSFETFSHKRSILKNSFKLDIKLRYPPFTDFKLKLLKKFLK